MDFPLSRKIHKVSKKAERMINNKKDQFLTPLADALKKQADEHIVAFDVPGHKQSSSELAEYFGKRCVELDLNSRKSIDYLCQPHGVIREAELLAAEAFGAKNAFFMVGGTTASVQAMIMSVCDPGDKIILPRNVHYSVINAVIIAGAIPVYVNPSVHPKLGIALGMCVRDVEDCIGKNQDAKAIFLNNPTYYGICSDIESIVSIAHRYGMKVLVDEAHGTHFYFHDEFPRAAMHCSADMAAVSMHKTGGSLTQSSILLSSDAVDPVHVNNIINLMRTTSASYLLMASLDIARRKLATQGRELLGSVIERAKKTRERINVIGNYWAFSDDIIDGDSVFDFDPTKLSVNTVMLGLAGIEVYSVLRDEYGIQLEFGDVNNILALATIGDSDSDHDALVFALNDIKRKYAKPSERKFTYEYFSPQVVLSPRKAFYSKKKYLPVAECKNLISGDSVMYYPPGIPLLAPGELITDEIISHILYAYEKGCTVTGATDNGELAVVDPQK